MRLFSTEAVSKYHPDKYADQISDAILTECLKQDRQSHCGIEAMVKGNTVVLGGEITSKADINYDQIVRRVAKKLGYRADKIVCDQYGGFCRVGGGAFSGKDPSKVDRSASYMAHKIACDLLEKFDLEWCEVQIGYAIGMSQPVSLSIRNDADMELFDYVTNTYDLTPAGIIRELDLLHADYETIAEGCHFYNKYNRTGRWK